MSALFAERWLSAEVDAGVLVLSLSCAHDASFAIIGVPIVAANGALPGPVRLATLEVVARGPLADAFRSAGFVVNDGFADVTFVDHVPSGEVASPTAMTVEIASPNVFAIEQTVTGASNMALAGPDLKTHPLELVAVRDHQARGSATLTLVGCWCLEGAGSIVVMGEVGTRLVADQPGVADALGMPEATLEMHANATAR